MDGTGYMEPLPTTGQIAKALVNHRQLLDEHLELIQKTTRAIEALGNALLASNVRIKHLEDESVKTNKLLQVLTDNAGVQADLNIDFLLKIEALGKPVINVVKGPTY